MRLLPFFLGDLADYGNWWIAFIGVVYCATRYGRWFCIPVAFFLVACAVYSVDFNLIAGQMRKPDWNGVPDLDMIFMFGVLVRVVLVSFFLTPVAIVGMLLRRNYLRRTGKLPPAKPTDKSTYDY